MLLWSRSLRPVVAQSLGGRSRLGDGVPLDGLHHLTDQAVHDHHDGVAVLIGDVEGLLDEVPPPPGTLEGERTSVR